MKLGILMTARSPTNSLPNIPSSLTVDAKELGALLRELETVLRSGTTGNIVEFGCYVGTTSLFYPATAGRL